tara:strand:+ start:210 stop:545 length:336 start_codon:yes stop_codon:yes gene_type:complete
MPLYDYVCSNCQHQLEDVQQSIKDKPLVECEQCGHIALERIIYGGDIFVKGEPTTIGQLADRNTKKMGKYEAEAKQKEDNTRKQLSDKQKLHKRINSMTASQKNKWIKEGN